MDIYNSKHTLHLKETLCEESEERAVDMSVVLPDYVPPVAAVLKCTLHPSVTNRFQSNDRFTVDGVTVVRILYVSDDRERVYCYETSQPFNVGFQCENAVFHHVNVKADYVNCRAVSPRRLDVHGSFRVLFKAEGQTEYPVFSDPQQNGVFCQTQLIRSCVPMREVEKSVTISETIELGKNRSEMLYSEAVIASSECKLLTNKLIAKGVLRLKAVLCHGNENDTVYEEIPFSQIIDIEGLREDCECSVDISVGENDTYLQQNETGGGLLFISCKLLLCARYSETYSEPVVLDAYCVDYPLFCEKVNIRSDHSDTVERKVVSLTQTTDAPGKLSSIIDSWGEIKSYDLMNEKDEKKLHCCLNVCLIGKEEDGHIGYYERAVDCIAPAHSHWDMITMKLMDLSVLQVGDTLRVQADTEAMNICPSMEKVEAICGVVPDKDNPYLKQSAAIRIVYANPGDTVWNIAKEHHASAQDIMEENSLKDDMITDQTMLMISMI